MFNFFASTDVLLNLSGINPLREWLVQIPKRAFIDTEPTFTNQTEKISLNINFPLPIV